MDCCTLRKFPTSVLRSSPNLERAMGIEPTTSAWKAEALPLNYARILLFIGRGDRIRTCDTLLPRQVLYQTELHPDYFFISGIPTRTRTLTNSFGGCCATNYTIDTFKGLDRNRTYSIFHMTKHNWSGPNYKTIFWRSRRDSNSCSYY